MEFQDLPTELIVLIKTNLSNEDLEQFDATCPEVSNAGLSRNEVSARKCGYHGKFVKQIFAQKEFKCGHVSCFRYLSNKVPETELINYIEVDNNYALHWAVRHGHTGVVRMLLDSGANAQADNNSALHLAARHGHTEVIKLLLDRGANARADNIYALHWAALNGHTEAVRMLLDSGANVQADNNYALRCAVHNGHIETIKLLLDKGANTHTYIDHVLRWATHNDHTEVIKILKYIYGCALHLYGSPFN